MLPEGYRPGLGGRDHGTVIHANKLVASRMEEDVRVRDIVLRLEEDLKD